MYQDRFNEVRSRINDDLKGYVQGQVVNAAGKAGKSLLKKGGKMAAKLAARAAKAFLQIVIKGVVLLLSKLGLFAVAIILILLILSMAFAFEYKGVYRNFMNDEKKENRVGYVQAAAAGDVPNIPPQFIPFYNEASARYDVDWWTLAAIHKTETSFSTDVTVSSAGALGHMQFMPTTWYGDNNEKRNPDPVFIKKHGGFGVDADGDGKADPFSVKDAIFSAANYLNHDHYRDSPLDALDLYGHSRKYAERVYALGKAFAGQPATGGIIDRIIQWWEEMKLLGMSKENEDMLQRYQKISRESVNIIDKFEQEENYRTTWGLLAALDTTYQMVSDNDVFSPERWDAKLRPSFKYRDSQKITIVTVTVITKSGSRTTTTKTVENYKILTQANTFAGIFDHFYKKQVTQDTRVISGKDSTTIIKTKITQEVPSYTEISPDFSRLINIVDSFGIDGQDYTKVLELADTYDSGELNLDEIDSYSFWTTALNQLEDNTIYRGDSGSLPGSIGSGHMGNFATWPIGSPNRISSGYGTRKHPVLGINRTHWGLDLSGPNGSYEIKDKPILAAAAGTVIFSGGQRGYGNVAIIDHGNGVSTLYGHMRDKPLPNLGDHVEAGQPIGYVGKTGLSKGEHLHFEVRINGKARNPLDWRFSGGSLPVNLDNYQN